MEFAKLTRHGLLQALDDDLTIGDNTDAGRFEGSPRRAIVEEKLRHADAVDDPRTAAFNADAGAARRFAHLGEGAGAVGEFDGEVGHRKSLETKGGATCRNVGSVMVGSK